MAWTTPKTWNPDETLLSADMNAQLRDNADYLKTYVSRIERFASAPAAVLGKMYQDTTNEKLYICKES